MYCLILLLLLELDVLVSLLLPASMRVKRDEIWIPPARMLMLPLFLHTRFYILHTIHYILCNVKYTLCTTCSTCYMIGMPMLILALAGCRAEHPRRGRECL